jgi:pantoate--beta-alanine ligase
VQEEDLRKLAEAGCRAVFMPKTLYHPGSSAKPNGDSSGAGRDAGMVVGASDAYDPTAHETWVSVEHLSQGLCAKTRPHFFRGVCTVRRRRTGSGAGTDRPCPCTGFRARTC